MTDVAQAFRSTLKRVWCAESAVDGPRTAQLPPLEPTRLLHGDSAFLRLPPPPRPPLNSTVFSRRSTAFRGGGSDGGGEDDGGDGEEGDNHDERDGGDGRPTPKRMGQIAVRAIVRSVLVFAGAFLVMFLLNRVPYLAAKARRADGEEGNEEESAPIFQPLPPLRILAFAGICAAVSVVIFLFTAVARLRFVPAKVLSHMM